jgi:hypothetical protein
LIRQLAFLLPLLCRLLHSSSTPCNTSFLTRSFQWNLSIPLQHHTSKLSMYFA